jgi:hypothetical protein
MATAITGPVTKQYEEKQITLRKLVESIVVTDPETCLQAKTLQRDIRSEMKLRRSVLDPFVEAAKSNLAKAKDELNKWIVPLQTDDDTLATKVKEYEREERHKAEAEQERINAERRAEAEKKAAEERKERERLAKEEKDKKIKEIRVALKRGDIGQREAAKMLQQAGAWAEAQAEQAAADAEAKVQAVKDAPVTVKPNIPSVSGVPSRVNYKVEVRDVDVILLAWATAVFGKDADRAAYLRQFITIDTQALGAEARKIKDSKKLESLIQGIRAWDE